MHAPDLYIPVMSFTTYMLLAGIVLGSRSALEPGNMRVFLSKGVGVLTLEAAVIETDAMARRHRLSWLKDCRYRTHGGQQPHRA